MKIASPSSALVSTIVALCFSGFFASCAPSHTSFENSVGVSDSPLGVVNANGLNVRARAKFRLSTGTEKLSLMNWLLPSADAANVLEPIEVQLAPSTNFAIDTSQFNVPSSPTPFAVNDFGFLRISTLQDNNLDICGQATNAHCGTAIIRAYTEGADGAGLWDSVDQYGAPIAGGQSQLSPIGLSEAGAANLQVSALPSGKHVVLLTDLPNAKYDFQVDFTNAGAGTYATTLVIEYALAQ